MVVRKIMLVLVAIAFMVSMVPASYAACSTCAKPAVCAPCAKPCDPCAGDCMKKLGRGLANCLTFPIEIPNQISKTNNCEGPCAAATVGLVKGIVMAGFRAVVGVYEVVTFPIPIPDCYAPILTDPEYMLEGWNC